MAANDTLLASYPRSGSTWLRFLLFECVTGRPADFSSVDTYGTWKGPGVLPGGGRLISTHERYCDVDRKVIYLARDPRSIIMSEFRLRQRQATAEGSFDAFVPSFVKGKAGPFGSWNNHVDFWVSSLPARRGNLHLVKYEDLRAGPEECLADIVRFLGIPADGALIKRAVENNTVERMRSKEDEAPPQKFKRARSREVRFVNQGLTQGWKEGLTSHQIGLIERHMGSTLIRLGYGLSNQTASAADGP
ncbi:MAG: sulfotransferase domain-containing protein [Actinobacteria bacterium]|nr:sulfotransferase domain-containing protein [Actinomycetota bacterium]